MSAYAGSLAGPKGWQSRLQTDKLAIATCLSWAAKRPESQMELMGGHWPALCRRRRSEIAEMLVPPGDRSGSDLRRTLQCVTRLETRGRPEGQPYPRSQQVVRA
jgi:hypothetical protein